jgi:2-polyprenyl-3-methyl-5-hydroxy-6-metoxy-1,4-benzoquinol methylase
MCKADRPVLRTNPSEQWERFGRDDPYYGVVTREEMRASTIDEDVRAKFFDSGEEEVEELMDGLRRFLGAEAPPRRVLDYGCGVGRLLIPLARRAESIVGVDVSPSMLAEARRNCDAFGLERVELLPVEALDRLPPVFDLVHSALVLQHIPVRQGERIVGRLADLVRPGGIGALHVQIGARRGLRAYNAAMRVRFVHNVANLIRRRPWSYPHMEMHIYDLGRLMMLLRDRGVPVVHVQLADRFGGYDPCMLLFRRA